MHMYVLIDYNFHFVFPKFVLHTFFRCSRNQVSRGACSVASGDGRRGIGYICAPRDCCWPRSVDAESHIIF